MTRLKTLERRNLILGVLAVVMLIPILLMGRADSSSGDKEGWQKQFPDFDPALARKIEITRPASGESDDVESITLMQRSGGDWVVASQNGYPARQSTIDTLLDGVAAMRARKLVTSRQETFEKYGATGGFTNVVVTGVGNKAMAAFGLGRDAETYPEVFTRVGTGDDAKIYQTIHVTRSMTEPRFTDWVEPRLWPGVRAELMLRLDVTRGDETLVFARRGEKPSDVEGDVPAAEEGKAWWILEPEPAGEPRDDGTVDNLGRFFSGLRLDGVAGSATDAEGRARYGLEPAAATVTLWQRDGEEIARHTLLVGSKSEDGRRYHVQMKGRQWVYLVPVYAVSDFLKPVAEFRPVPPEPEDPDDGGETPPKEGDGG